MSATPMAREMSPKLIKVMERAKNDPEVRHLSLAHLIDPDALMRAYRKQRKAAGVGVDGVNKEQYGQSLDDNIRDLHARLKGARYRHQPIRRVHIPKGTAGQTRPIGVSCIEDKLVQGALREVLEAVYEPTFYEGSYGFRPGRGAHDALRALNQTAMKGRMNWVLEADIRSYFDSIDRNKLMEMLSERIADTSFLRLVGKCLHVGVLDDGAYSEPDEGTAQGSSLSPALGNIYLHHVLDVWFTTDMTKRLKGHAHLIRYADDFLIGFVRREDADAVMCELEKRMAQYGLTLHPDKTRIVAFQKPGPTQKDGKGPGTFDFLGFTAYWRRSRKGTWILALKTRTQRLGRAVQAVKDYCRRHRHKSVEDQRVGLNRRLIGHYNYFGVNGNIRAMAALRYQAERIWHKWLGRRSQRGSIPWEKFGQVLKAHPLARPTIRVQIWGTTS